MSAATVNRLNPTQVELEISIQSDELEAAQERAFRELSRNAKIPGFRPGKAPRKVFEAQYGIEGINERAMEAIARDAYSKAVRENDLEPVEPPDLELLPLEAGQPLRLRATVEVRPTIELHDYKGVPLTAPAAQVTDADVDHALESLRNDSATLTPVDRPIELGDVATLDYDGTIDGEPFEGGKGEKHPAEMREADFIPGFVAGVVGMRTGETKLVEATFPDDYSKKDLAGKKAQFTVTAHEVNARELPNIDDDFAKRFTRDENSAKNANLATLKQEIRQRLEAAAKGKIRRALTTIMIDRLMEKHNFALPAAMVDRETAALTAEAQSYVGRAGLDWNEYLKQQNRTEADLQQEYRKEAERRVKSTLLLEAIAKAEKIEATQKDMENEIAALSRQYGQPPQAIVEMLRPNHVALVDGIVRSKTIEWLLDHANITEGPLAEPGKLEPGAHAT